MLCSYCHRQCQCGKSANATDTAVCKLLHKGLNTHRLSGKYSDVSVRVDEKIFQCHRIVLASACEFFDSMFGGNFKEGSPENTVTLIDIDAVSFEIILEFIYLGREPILSHANIYGLLRSSDFLRLQKIKNMSVEYILKNASSFSSTNTFEIFHLACGMNDHLVMVTLGKYIVLHLQDFVREDFFVEMAYDCLSLVLQTYQSSSVHFSSENFLLDAAVRWVFHNPEERRKFFTKLMETINFDKITADCMEFWLKECKIDYTRLKESRSGAPLKALILNAFLSDYEFTINDDASPVSFQDPPSKINPSIYVYARLMRKNSSETNTYNVFSLNEPHNYSEIEAEESSLSQSSSNEYESKSKWLISSTFSLKLKEYGNFTLVTLNKPNRIFCFVEDKFLAYSSIDLSSNEYTILKAPKLPVQPTQVCATNNGYIYAHLCYIDYDIQAYDCTADKWFEIPKPEEKVFQSGFVADNNFLYLIEGVNSNQNVCNESIQVYDCRTPRWLRLSKVSEKKKTPSWSSSYSSSSHYYGPPLSCFTDGKIYVYDGRLFRVFDVTARKWRSMKLKRIGEYGWYNDAFTNSSWTTSSLWSYSKMICHGNKLLVFQQYRSKYLICDYKTENYEEQTLFDDSSYAIGDFTIQNVISFNSMKI